MGKRMCNTDTPMLIKLMYRHFCKLYDSKESYTRNRSRVIERSKKWRESNPDKFKEYKAFYRAKNIKRVRASDRQYQKEKTATKMGDFYNSWRLVQTLEKEIRNVKEKEK